MAEYNGMTRATTRDFVKFYVRVHDATQKIGSACL